MCWRRLAVFYCVICVLCESIRYQVTEHASSFSLVTICSVASDIDSQAAVVSMLHKRGVKWSENRIAVPKGLSPWRTTLIRWSVLQATCVKCADVSSILRPRCVAIAPCTAAKRSAPSARECSATSSTCRLTCVLCIAFSAELCFWERTAERV